LSFLLLSTEPVDAQRSIDLHPGEWADSCHPLPGWAVELMRRSAQGQQQTFRNLSQAKRLEFAVFQTLLHEPPYDEWVFRIARDRTSDTLMTLAKAIDTECSDLFAMATITAGGMIAVERLPRLPQQRAVSSDERNIVYTAAVRRVARMKNPMMRANSEPWLETIRSGHLTDNQ
jgi:hypothetical protein